jgi:urea transport system permease protein
VPEFEIVCDTSLQLDMVTTAAALFAVVPGLLAVFGVLKIVNFAQGAFLTLGAYTVLVTTNGRSINK